MTAAIVLGSLALTAISASAQDTGDAVISEVNASEPDPDAFATDVRSVLLVVVPVVFIGLAAAAIVVRGNRGGSRQI